MKISMIVIRLLLGVLLLFASVTYLFKLIPIPPAIGQVKVYNEGLAVVNLMLYVKIIELLCGLAFITGRFVTLAALLILPVVFNVILFHSIVAPSGIGPGTFLLFGDLFLIYYYRKNYTSLFLAK